MKKSLKITAVLFLLAVFWLFYFILQFTYGTPENNNLNYIPNNAHTVIAFNGDLALKSVIDDFISSQDQQLLGEINDSKDDLKQSTGIDVLSDFVLFTLDNNGLEVTGWLINLNSERDFKSHFEGSIISSNSSVGVIIQNENKSDRAKLQQLANSILKKENSIYNEKLVLKRNSESLISVWTRAKSSKNWSCANLSVNGAQIKVDGTAIIQNTATNKLTRLKPNNSSFHFTGNGHVPAAVNDSMVKLFQIEDNQIIGVSANYRSLKIEQETSFEIVPNADFIFQFANPIDVTKLLNLAQSESIVSDLTANTYNYGGRQFYYNQISANSFYLGRTKDFQTENSASILSIHGAPEYLAKVEGSSFMLRVINIFPFYRMTKGLSKTIKSIDIEVENTQSNSANIKGKIEFKKGKYASIELIRNLLELR